jgi:hypothetical protein
MDRRLPMVQVDLRTPGGPDEPRDAREPTMPPPEWFAAMEGRALPPPDPRNGPPHPYPHPGPLYPGPIYPGRGYPPNPGEDRLGLSAFGRLAKGQALGKSSILIYDSTATKPQFAPVDMIGVEGDDLDACQLLITLAPPRVIALPFADVQQDIDQQALSGEQTNSEITIGDFPGTGAPIAWPPLEAHVEFGIKGASATAIIDYLNGITFSVVASYLRVRALVSQSAASGDISGTSAAYYLAAFVGPGWAKGSNAQRTIYVGSINDSTESDVFDVPKFARRAYVVGCDTTTPPAVTAGFVRFYQSSNGNVGLTCVGNLFVNANQPTAFDIPAAASYFTVFNQSGKTMKMSVIFELALS